MIEAPRSRAQRARSSAASGESTTAWRTRDSGDRFTTAMTWVTSGAKIGPGRAGSSCGLTGGQDTDVPSEPPTPSAPDAVRLRRARIARVVKALKRLGYYLLLLAMVAFAVALTTGFAGFWVWVCVVSLLVAVVVLPLPIIIGYGIRAAEREDRTAV